MIFSQNIRNLLGSALIGGIMLALSIVGVRMYVQSNWSSEERMNTEVGRWNENIATALAEVNARQSLLMSAALVCGIDARALGAGIMARRLMNVQPVQQEVREILGSTTNIGFAQVSVQSTEAALRIVFTPSLEDSLLYYQHTGESSTQDTYQTARTALAPLYQQTLQYRENLHHILRTNEWANAHIAALAMKQAQMRFLNEQAHSLEQTSFAMPSSTPHYFYFSAEEDEVRQAALLLYLRDDVLP
jgi:hypothetical protein